MTVSPDQLATAKAFARTFRTNRRGAGAPVRRLFVQADQSDVSPLSTLLSQRPTEAGEVRGGGGRGGALRVKLYISLLWVAAKEPYSSARPARSWADLIGLDDPSGNGARRIRSTFLELAERNYVRVERRKPGEPTEVFLLDESGNGSRYTVPGSQFAQSDEDFATPKTRHEYFRIPEGFWTRGVIADLTGPGLAMFLILLSESRGAPRPVWFAPAQSRNRYGLSDGTRKSGLKELSELGLVKVRRQGLAPGSARLSAMRSRNVYTLQYDRLLPTDENGN